MKNLEDRFVGLDPEDKVEQALKFIEREQTNELNSPIRRIIRAQPNSRLNRQQIDFLIIFENNCEIPVQVKTSWSSARNFVRRLCRNQVIIVIAAGERTAEDISVDLRGKILQAFRKLERLAREQRVKEMRRQERLETREARRQKRYRYLQTCFHPYH